MPNLFQRLGAAFATQPSSPYKDSGVPGYAVFGGYLSKTERNARLTGMQRFTTASEMLANISIVAGSLRYFLNLLAKPEWKIEPADDSDAAKEAAEFVEDILEQCGTSMHRVVRRGGMFKFHGFSFQEWIALKRPDGRIGLADIKQRPQQTINRWDMDDRGNLKGIEQVAVQTGQAFYIPRNKLIYLVDDTLTDSPDGMGWFRHLAEPAERLEEYLSKEGIGFTRDLSGVPVARAPLAELKGKVGTPSPNGGVYTDADISGSLDGIRDFVGNKVRQADTSIMLDSAVYKDSTDSGQKSGSVYKWGIDLLTGKTESLPDIAKAIERLTYDMARIMGTEGMMAGADGSGSLALSKNKSENLYLNVNSTLVDMAESMGRDIIDPLWAMNGLDDAIKPKMKAGEIIYRDVEQASAAIRDLAAAGAVLEMDDPAINDLRALAGLPHQPEMTPERMEAMAQLAAIRNPIPEGDGSEPDPDPDKGGDEGDAKAVNDKLEKYNPNQPRVPGGDGGGQWTSGGGGGASTKAKPLTDKDMQALMDGQKGNTVEELHAKAVENQYELARIGEEISQDIDGADFSLPPGANKGVKKFEGAVDKIARKGYEGPHRLTDLTRASFIVDTPEAANAALGKLTGAVGGDVFDEGWKTQPNSLYTDRKALIRFPNGAVGEVQFISRGMHKAKFIDGGHDLYELAREPTTPRGQAVLFDSVMRALYEKADKGSPFENYGKK